VAYFFVLRCKSQVTLDFIKKQLEKQAGLLSDRKRRLKSSRKDMWENTVHYSNDFDRLVEANQYQIPVYFTGMSLEMPLIRLLSGQ
jgi:DNA helicase-2/ATP-dependent DNA helicase PcrA